MIADALIILVGFTIVAAVILALAYIAFLPGMRKSLLSKTGCALFLGAVAGLQWHHYRYFAAGEDVLADRAYLFLLMLAPPSFFFFARVVLFPESRARSYESLYFAPVLLAFVLPVDALPPVAFLIGTVCAFWIARVVWGLRGQRERFKFEMFFFGLFAVMALSAFALGLALPYMDDLVFYAGYSASIGAAMVLVVAALIIFPDLLSDILVVTELAYANSKLGGIDQQAAAQKLEHLIRQEHIYQDEGLNLSTCAELMELSSHQLSELVNTQFKCGFPRYLRSRRIEQAKKLLLGEPTASILAISMMTGFKSQSSFYAAFKEVEGEAPGRYRRRHAAS